MPKSFPAASAAQALPQEQPDEAEGAGNGDADGGGNGDAEGGGNGDADGGGKGEADAEGGDVP